MNARPPTPNLLNAEPSIYHGGFWLAYLANVVLVCANSLTFHFAEFIAALAEVDHLAGVEEVTGMIVSTGLLCAVGMRLVLGPAIDRYGTRYIWLVSSVLLVSGDLAYLLPGRLTPLIWAARISYQVGLAGMFSSSIVHIQNQVPPHRRTEVIGVLGSSGFVGTIIGTQVGDAIFNYVPAGTPQFVAMFGGSGLLGVLHLILVFRLTRNDVHQAPDVTPPSHRLLVRYWPGTILLVAMAMGTSFTVTTVFLTRFATASSLRGIGTFFMVYSVTAFCCRWFSREWGDSMGRHRMVLWGLSGLAVGQWLFLLVSAEWMFIFPAVACGFGHALLFPAVVSLGAGCFPVQYRGTGTTLVLGFTELGTIVSAPLLGAVIDYYDGAGYSQMFLMAGAVAMLVGLIYAATAARRPDHDPHVVRTPVLSNTELERASTVAASDPLPQTP